MTKMKLMLLLDNKIKLDQLEIIKREVASIYKTNADITLEFREERRDFTFLPKVVYSPGFEGIAWSYLQAECDALYSRFAEDIDQVVFMVHSDNWTLQGVWGWNTSVHFKGYGVQQVRFDGRNNANTIGTLYHELMHDHDAFIWTYTLEQLAQTLSVRDWDEDVVHGRSPQWSYIRFKENQNALKTIGPALVRATIERRRIWDKKKLSMLQEIYRLAQQLEILWRLKLIQNGRKPVPIKPNNQCCHTH